MIFIRVMASVVKNIKGPKNRHKKKQKIEKTEILTATMKPEPTQEKIMPDKNKNKVEEAPSEEYISSNADAGDDFDFVEHYDDNEAIENENILPENLAASAISCGFLGVGGGGGKLAKAFLDLGFNKTLLINTTVKDQPEGVDPSHFMLLPGADGVGKDVDLGKSVLEKNSSLVEDILRNRLGKVDWLFVLAGGGGGTGSACHVLHDALNRYMKSSQAGGEVVYIVSSPTAQEMLNPTIRSNFETLKEDVSNSPHLILDNERQLQLLRGRMGMLNMYPAANRSFAKLFWQLLKLADEVSPIQSFDSKDLERCLRPPGRLFVGTTIIKNPNNPNLGSTIFQNCLKQSPCPEVDSRPNAGVLLLIVTPEMISDPQISNHMEAAISYVGGRTDTLFSGVYVRRGIPGLVAITALSGLN